MIKEENKGKKQLSSQERGERLIAWVEDNRRGPKQSEEHGMFWSNIKMGQSKAVYDSILSSNSILKAEYEKTQTKQEEKKRRGKQSPQEKGDQLIAWVEKNGRVPKYTEEYGVYWNSIKQGHSKDLYISFLAKHPILKANYEDAHKKKEEKKEKEQQSPREKADQLILWVEDHGRVPKNSEEWGRYWNHIKQGVNKSIYDSQLSVHPILRGNYEKTQRIKESKIGVKKQSPQDKGKQFLMWVEEHGRVPKNSEEWGVYWTNAKKGQSKAIYESILSTHPILQADYELSQKKRITKQYP
jgi:DNA gyrase inhibitor GyrI